MHSDTGVDVVVVGAGVAGLSCGAVLARRGRAVLVIERREGPGRETSSRNSEVIHAGLYYPPGTLKALSCVEGRERLYHRCRVQGIPHRRTGKLVVATQEQELEVLEHIQRRARANGAGAVEILSAAEVRRREPRIRALAALWSPESGIVDSHSLMLSYLAEMEAASGTLLTRTRVVGLNRREAAGGIWEVETESSLGERFSVTCPIVVNAAGLESDRVAAFAGLDTQALGYTLHFCKGDYFAIAPGLRDIAKALIYPVPVPGGLGIHVTRDLGGRYRLGPDTEYVAEPRYDIDPTKAEAFAAAAQRYLPELRPEHLTPDFAGVRPKLQGPGEPFRDFVVSEESPNGAPGLINMIGIESPGLTASEALAERVAILAGDD
jgi:L-2-hydroxyglutarate oxidase LhgO